MAEKNQKKLQKEYIKDTTMLVLACISFVVGIVLTFCGFYAEPVGEISGSVLGGTGQFLTFAGALLGIGEYGKIQMRKIQYGDMSEKEREKNGEYGPTEE